LNCARLASAKQECACLKQAASADRSTQPERLTQLLTDMTNDRDKVHALITFSSDMACCGHCCSTRAKW